MPPAVSLVILGSYIKIEISKYNWLLFMKFLHSISPPPPVGGVTKSVKNLSDSLESLGYQSHFINQFRLFNSYDVGHVHASHPIKRLLCILVMKLVCKKVVFTVHGLNLELNIINYLSVRLADGTIFLNSKLFNKWRFLSKAKFTILPSIFKEGVNFSNDMSSNSLFDNEKLTILLYSQSHYYKNGEEVYGIDFALNSLALTPLKYNIILIDLDGGYKYLLNKFSAVLDIKYFDKEVDFNAMLSKSDFYLRPTSMDGSSLAIQEALLRGKIVVASNVVDRPNGVNLYEHLNSSSLLESLDSSKNKRSSKFSLKSVVDYVDFIKQL